MSAHDILQGLNPAQHDAVIHRGGPLLVVAGAGSGKTRVLTHRIAHLIQEDNVNPFQILAITFTNKAAQEMKDRVAALVGPVAEKMWVSTFHSACVRILRRDAEQLGYPSAFSIYDQADATRLTGYVVRDLGLDNKKFVARSVHAQISNLKNELISTDAALDRADGIFDRKIAEIYDEYQRRLRTAGAMDFDDLLTVTVQLFNNFPDALSHYQERFQHVLVDEYQDTNQAQNDIVLKLGDNHRNVFVVGDSDQSVYAFRGADIRNILEFEKAFPDTGVVVLDQNYRSTQTILDAANSVISNNYGRKPKELWTDKSAGDKIVLYRADDEVDEAAWIIGELERLHGQGGLRWSDVAIFYRANAQSRIIEERLAGVSVPYRVVGGPRFYDRREVKDALAYLRAVVNPADEVSLKRVLNVPKRGIGDSSVARLDQYANSNGVPFNEALNNWPEVGISGPAKKGLANFTELLRQLSNRVSEGPAELLQLALERSGYIEELRDERSIEAEGRLENLAELIGSAEQYETCDEFLEQVSLVSPTDELDDQSEVTLMTLHTAKGLEFPIVFVVGMEDGIFPSFMSLGDPDQLEEERRLAYVGITRAEEQLYLTLAESRWIYGQQQYNTPSRFLREIPDELLDDRSPRGIHKAGRTTVSATTPVEVDEDKRAERRERARERIIEKAIAAGTQQPTSPSPSLKVGDDVHHPKFGEGVILQLLGSGDNAEVTINFVDIGQKTLLLGWANLQKPLS
ncbi:MAG TPA: DNA helicase PcrA [Acidimicrobiaceae bacterium]|nr:DNA helicase PcrA [Acidimicrobiaceae bacterium]